MEYQDFELRASAGYKIRAESDQGEIDDDLSLDLDKIGLALQLVEREQTNLDLLQGLGARLHDALLPADIHAHLRATVAAADAVGSGVRLRLVLDPPELSALPWEFLFDDDTNTFLGNSIQTVLSRYIPVPLPRRDIRVVTPPLKILLVLSDPKDLPRLDLAGEEDLIREGMAQQVAAGRVEIDTVSPATIRTINQALREKPYNVFHYVGHGDFRDDQGAIALEDEDGLCRLVDDQTFSNFFLGNRTLGLAVLNSCKGAVTSSGRAFVGIAPNLVRRGIPAVIAMQYSILDDSAKLFASEFYRTLSLGWPIDAAVQTTRNALSMEVGLDKRDFATPVLFMRAKDGIILEGLQP
ncbi:MAG: CHAT domain-containing protein [Anaerolineae bacterium]|jgi:hypothetical protein